MNPLRILIVDDHSVVIEGIKSALAEIPAFEVIGEVNDGREAVKQVESHSPDIVIMDISLPGMSGVLATRRIKKIKPETKIIIYSMYSDKEYVIDLFKAGISAYVLKDDPLSDLRLALEAVKAGGTYFSTKAPSLLLQHVADLENHPSELELTEQLSQRELEVFRLLAEGRNIKEISQLLCISPKTVETHKYNIMAKLRAKSVVELTKMAIRKNLIKI